MTSNLTLEDIFFAALAKESSEERDAYLREACAGAGDLRRQIDRMLEAQKLILLQRAVLQLL